MAQFSSPVGQTVTVYKVTSDSNPSAYYEVHFYEDGRVTCECPSFRYSSSLRGCKHVERLKGQGAGFSAPSPTKVFVFEYEGQTTVVTDNQAAASVEAALEALREGKELTIKRVA